MLAPGVCCGLAAGYRPGPAGSRDIARQRLSQRRGMPGGQVDLIPGAVQPEATVPSAWVPSRSSMSRVCIFWATDAPSLPLPDLAGQCVQVQAAQTSGRADVPGRSGPALTATAGRPAVLR